MLDTGGRARCGWGGKGEEHDVEKKRNTNPRTSEDEKMD